MPRRHPATLRVAQYLTDHIDESIYGYPLCAKLKLKPGSLYPILARLHNAGWLAAEWEDPYGSHFGPPRRMYRVTAAGRVGLAELLRLDEPL